MVPDRLGSGSHCCSRGRFQRPVETTIPDPITPSARAILVLDTVGVRRQVYLLLSQAGYRVYEARSESEALEVVHAVPSRLALVIIDVPGPAVNGLALGERIREINPNIRLLLAVPPGMALTSDLVSDGVLTLLPKPFTRDELLESTAAALRGIPSGAPTTPNARA